MSAVIGIDFGTTTSKIACFKDGKAFAVKNKNTASEITPSLVGLNENINELKIGKQAERLTSSVIADIKRKLGEKTKVILGEKSYLPEEIASMIFKHLKEYSEDFLVDDIREVVISVPAYFNDYALTSTLAAAEEAGLSVLKIIKEPVAAALAYGYGKNFLNKNVLVYDFGGGTFNAGVVRFSEDSIDLVAFEEVKYLGGAIFDQRLIRMIKEYLIALYGITEFDDNIELKLRNEAVKAKELLSSAEHQEIQISFIVISGGKILNVKIPLTREKLDQLVEDLVSETLMVIDSMFEKIKISKGDIDVVVLAGGSTRMPGIKERVKEYFGFAPLDEIDPELVVCYGAAIQAGILKGAAHPVSWF